MFVRRLPQASPGAKCDSTSRKLSLSNLYNTESIDFFSILIMASVNDGTSPLNYSIFLGKIEAKGGLLKVCFEILTDHVCTNSVSTKFS